MHRRDTEHKHQVALFQWAAYQTRRWPELALLFAIPNGGARDKVTGGRLKAEGVKAGVPDMLLPVARGPYHGFFIELKAPDGTPSDKQERWVEDLQGQGYRAEVIYGWPAARDALMSYLCDHAALSQFTSG
jgi:VRR-NUC domain